MWLSEKLFIDADKRINLKIILKKLSSEQIYFGTIYLKMIL